MGRMVGNLRFCAAEFVGTFGLVFLSAGAAAQTAGHSLGLLTAALTYGLAAAAVFYLYGPVSGGHFNPAVTLSFFLNRRLDAAKTSLYIAAQLLGAACAGLLLKMLLRESPGLAADPTCLVNMEPSIGFKAATLLEAVGTFFVASTLHSLNGRARSPEAFMALGATITVCAWVATPLSGGAFNPARAFGPAIATGLWDRWFVFWIGPLAGAAAAGLIHRFIFPPNSTPS